MDDRPDLASEHGARYAPTLVFLDAEGKKVAQEAGYRSPRQVLGIFREAGIMI